MKTTLKVEGLSILEEALVELGVDNGVKVLRAAIRESAKPMIAKAKQKVTYDFKDPDGPDGYHLKDNIKLQMEPKRSRRMLAQYRLGAARVTTKEGPYKIEGGLSKSSRAPNYAQLLEKEKPWLRPAFDEEYRGFLSGFAAILRKRIESTAKRMAKKAAKAKGK